jgi:uncharacterized membrane protein YkvA (DUF1232 family)
MGEVNAKIYVREKSPKMGWTYVRWDVNFGKGQEPVQEDVKIICAESSQRHMSREAAVDEAKTRIRVQIEKECGEIPEQQIKWATEEAK